MLVQANNIPLQIRLGGVIGQGIRDLVDQLFQLLLGLLQAIIDRPRPIARNQLDLFAQALVQRPFADLVGKVLLIVALVRTGLAIDCTRDREERPDVAGTVHQARPEKQARSRKQAVHFMLGLRVAEVAQLDRRRQVRRLAIPDLRALGVLCPWWKAPLDADAVDQAGGGQERHRRRQANLTFQVGQRGRDRDRGNVERTHCTHPGHVLPGIDPAHIGHQFTGTRYRNPLAGAPLPFDVITHGVWRRVPGDRHDGDSDALLDHYVLTQHHPRRRVLGTNRDPGDWPGVDNGAVVDSVKFTRVVLDHFELELVPLRPRDVADVELHQLQVFVIKNPPAFRLGLLAEIRHHGHVTTGNRLHYSPLGPAAGQVDHQTSAHRHGGVTVERHHAPSRRRYAPAIVPTDQHRVRHGDDLTRLRDVSIETNTEHTALGLELFGQRRPLPGALGLAQGSTPNRADGSFTDHAAELDHCLIIEDRLLVGFETLVRVIPGHHVERMAVAGPGAFVLDGAVVQDLRLVVGVHRITRHIGIDHDLAAVPEGQAVED